MTPARKRAASAPDIQVKRVYDAPARTDGHRVLVDRVWPRGVSKAAAALDEWCRELAPSTALRQWFGHDPKRWAGFQRRYRAELRQHQDLLGAIRERARHGRVTLLYGARNEEFNQAVALRNAIVHFVSRPRTPPAISTDASMSTRGRTKKPGGDTR